MNFVSIYRVIIFAWQSFWRNFWLSIVTISIILLTLISINSLIVVNIITTASMQIIKEKVDISIYFKPDILEPQVMEAQNYLSSLPQVKEIKYISQKDALESFRQKHQRDTIIIESLEELQENPISATLQLKAKDISDYPAIIEIINNSKYNSIILDKNFDDHKVYISKIQALSDNIKKIGLATSLLFIFIALLIVFNTIRVAIYTHREEITIMKLVGATNSFIGSPFLAEAVIYGVIAIILAITLTYPILNFLQPYLNNFFLTEEFSLVNYVNQHFLLIFGLEFLAVSVLNVVSSMIAIRKYLKV